MSESLGRATPTRDQRSDKRSIMEDTPEAREARIRLYTERANNRQCVFTGKPHGYQPIEDDEDDEE